MAELNTTIEFDVCCTTHRKSLKVTVDQRRGNDVWVEPCEECLERAEDQGYERGLKEE